MSMIMSWVQIREDDNSNQCTQRGKGAEFVVFP